MENRPRRTRGKGSPTCCRVTREKTDEGERAGFWGHRLAWEQPWEAAARLQVSPVSPPGCGVSSGQGAARTLTAGRVGLSLAWLRLGDGEGASV